MIMLVRTKVLLILLLVARSSEKTKMVLEDGDFQDGCVKSETSLCKVYCKCRLFYESYFFSIYVSLRGQNYTPNLQNSLLCQLSSFLNEKIKHCFIETKLPDTFSPVFIFQNY